MSLPRNLPFVRPRLPATPKPAPKPATPLPAAVHPAWPWNRSWSPDELAEMRARSVKELGRYAAKGFTCDSCAHLKVCDLAYDPYCTGGDCLADK